MATAAWKRWCRNLTLRQRAAIEAQALADPNFMGRIIEQGHGKPKQSGEFEVKVGALENLTDAELKAKLEEALKALG